MDSKTIRQKYLDFFKSRGHQVIPSAPLVPSEEEQLAGKEKVLFTSAGMQPLIPYLFGEPHPSGSNRLVDCQKCLRTDDIDEVGDTVHHTFFEMLGNWSLGDYWKKEAIEFSFEFLTKELAIPINKLAVSVFAGDTDAPRDEESAKTWLSLGIPENRVFYFDKKQNWWPTPRPNTKGELVLPTGPCGPDTEMFYWTSADEPEGSPDSDSRWVEIWNDVFMEFNHTETETLEPLTQKNVDTGMGLERTTAVLNNLDDNYLTDLFLPIVRKIEEVSNNKYEEDKEAMRIIADHMRASVFLIIDGVTPSNKLQGYILRRLLRRAAVKIYQLTSGSKDLEIYPKILQSVLNIYHGVQGIDESIHNKLVGEVVSEEIKRFYQTLDKGLKEVQKIENISGKIAFDLYQTYGFPLELTEELFKEKNQNINRDDFRKEFEAHKKLSRTASAGVFKGGLADKSQTSIKLHTATHLLHAALRQILGTHVKQLGSHITSDRLRFDFSHPNQISEDQLKQIEMLVNQKIKEGLEVKSEVMDKEEALKSGALAFFGQKYPDKVSVYSLGDFSKELCGGPHVQNTKELGSFKIIKQESAGAGIRRIYATVS